MSQLNQLSQFSESNLLTPGFYSYTNRLRASKYPCGPIYPELYSYTH